MKSLGLQLHDHISQHKCSRDTCIENQRIREEYAKDNDRSGVQEAEAVEVQEQASRG
jgi:hypothetical protein